MASLIGQSLGRYHILEQLGEGGMAVVYKAYDTRLETDVAVKVIRTDNILPKVLERTLKRFEREAKSVARLTHPNIVRVLDFGEYKKQPFLVMQYLPGGTLKGRLHGKPMPWRDAARLLLPVASALEHAHQQNIIHRDVKPANILLTQNGQPMLTDFGVAKILDEETTMDLTGTSAAVGTPEYMAPEQATSRSVDHRADIYALGIVFYEMVTGRKPYQADTPLAVLFKHASEPLPRPKQFIPDLPQGVENFLIKALSKQREDRYQDMAEVVRALERLLNEKGGGRAGETAPAVDQIVKPSAPTLRLPAIPRPVFIAAAGILLLAILITAASSLIRSLPAESGSPESVISTEGSVPSNDQNEPAITPSVPAQAINVPTQDTRSVTIVGGSEVYAYFDNARALGELAEEKYSLEERNRVNQELKFTIRLEPPRPVIWRWYWCAATDRILNENMRSIEVKFFLNDENITSRFGERTFPFTEAPMKGWSCFTYEAVLKDWSPGVYSLRQQTTLLNEINDGADAYPAGYKIYNYTVTVP